MSRATEFVEEASIREIRWHNYKFSGDEEIDDAFVHCIWKLETHAEVDRTREAGTLLNYY